MALKVVVAMSGGVDSSAAACLLMRQGYDIIGVTMSISALSNQAVTDAEKVAEKLGIPHYTVDLSEQFDQRVVEPFVTQYRMGKTPNPCVMCNRDIKWEMLTRQMERFNTDYVATGHYAEIVNISGIHSLKKAKNLRKDQTYALYRLTREQLSKTIMPLYGHTKDEVRSIALDAGLSVFDKPESQEICFVENDDYKSFIASYCGYLEKPGHFVLDDGTILGEHNGISRYTIGQRKGLGISYKEPLYVTEIDEANNRVILGSNEQLFKTDMVVSNVNFTGMDENTKQLVCYAKIRYAHEGAKCRISIADKIKCSFSEPQRAITPGQSAVFYDESGVVLAGGIIE